MFYVTLVGRGAGRKECCNPNPGGDLYSMSAHKGVGKGKGEVEFERVISRAPPACLTLTPTPPPQGVVNLH
jgi:hypothetical protein